MYLVRVGSFHYARSASVKLALHSRIINTGSSKKIPAKFGDTCSVRADGLCNGCLGQWAERGREYSNMQEFFSTTLYTPLYPFALRPSHQGLVQGWNLEVLLAARTAGRWKCRQSYADSMCGHSTRSRALSLSLMQSIPGETSSVFLQQCSGPNSKLKMEWGFRLLRT